MPIDMPAIHPWLVRLRPSRPFTLVKGCIAHAVAADSVAWSMEATG
jgi:hypothetical protein